MKLSKIEIMKLLSLPLSILLLSYLGFLAIKFQVALESETQGANATLSLRAPASINSPPDPFKKALQLQISLNENHDLKKPHGPIEVEVSSVDNRLILNRERSELIGTIKIAHDLEQVDVHWHLPKGVELVGGELKSIFYSVKAGEQKEIHIQILSHSDVNQQIHLEASFQQGADKIGHTAQFNTVDQLSLNQAAQQKTGSIHAQGFGHAEEKIWQ